MIIILYIILIVCNFGNTRTAISIYIKYQFIHITLPQSIERYIIMMTCINGIYIWIYLWHKRKFLKRIIFMRIARNKCSNNY